MRFSKLKTATFGKSDAPKSMKVKRESFCSRFNRIFQWFGLLSSITDDELKIICGTDGALYLVFNRYAARLFGVITVLNCAVLIPTYITGDNPGPEMFNKAK